jgi:hypothetical protein
MAETELLDGWDYIVALDDELMKGGYVLPEWAFLLTKEADTAFVSGAPVAAVLTAHAAVEAYLRGEGGRERNSAELIDGSGLPEDLVADLHRVRRYRNRWVHVDDPWDDRGELEEPEGMAEQAVGMARLALRSLRRVLYSMPWV